jgi:hypothetical protein
MEGGAKQGKAREEPVLADAQCVAANARDRPALLRGMISSRSNAWESPLPDLRKPTVEAPGTLVYDRSVIGGRFA